MSSMTGRMCNVDRWLLVAGHVCIAALVIGLSCISCSPGMESSQIVDYTEEEVADFIDAMYGASKSRSERATYPLGVSKHHENFFEKQSAAHGTPVSWECSIRMRRLSSRGQVLRPACRVQRVAGVCDETFVVIALTKAEYGEAGYKFATGDSVAYQNGECRK